MLHCASLGSLEVQDRGMLVLWEPRLDLPLEPFPEWLWDPPTKDLFGWQGERHSLAKSFQDLFLAAAMV